MWLPPRAPGREDLTRARTLSFGEVIDFREVMGGEGEGARALRWVNE